MNKRAIILGILMVAALAAFYHYGNSRPVKDVEQGFVDFLVANARKTLNSNLATTSSDVVVVEFKEEDREEYESWPPSPLDYIMVLKRVQKHAPLVVAIPEPLRWDNSDIQFLNQLKDTFIGLPSVVLAFEVDRNGEGMTRDAGDFAAQEMPSMQQTMTTHEGAPSFSRVTLAPARELRIATATGFIIPGESADAKSVTFAATEGSKLVPSFATQAITLFHRVPFSQQRIRFGTGARLSLNDELIVPLSSAGALEILARPEVPQLNALDLMNPELEDESSRRVNEVLGEKKLIIFTRSADGRSQAQAIAQALALPPLFRQGGTLEWIGVGLAALIGLWQLRCRRFAVLVWFAVGTAVMVGVNLGMFQSSLTWWSPLPAFCVLLVSTLYCILRPFTHREVTPPSPTDQVTA